MDFFVARLMSLSEHELRCLRSDAELQSHLQRTHLLMESKLQQYSNASSSSSPCGASGAAALMLAAAAADNYAALDLRLSDPHQGQQQQQHQQYHQQHQLHHLQLHYLQQQQQQQQQHHIQQQQQQQHNQRLQQQQQQHHYEQQQQEKCFNYKKMKFIEWSSGSTDNESSPTPTSLSTASTTLARDDLAASSPTTTPTTTTNHSHHLYSAAQSPSPTSTALTTLMPQPQQPQQQQQQLLQLRAQQQLPTPTTGGGKKYKGEFDEPSALEVELRLKLLMHDDNYHSKMSPRGECACILGSEFRDKSASSVLVMVEQWRQMPTEQRVTFKWDMNDLPKDIPLSDIKRFENLRREASDGRADFGGASKRKPLGIRGTRQFLLILYCLWGHPGRDDPMQREGYCPHCFAKIKKPNEQSTLVRVVNHFNMKHRRGANPRIA